MTYRESQINWYMPECDYYKWYTGERRFQAYHQTYHDLVSLYYRGSVPEDPFLGVTFADANALRAVAGWPYIDTPGNWFFMENGDPFWAMFPRVLPRTKAFADYPDDARAFALCQAVLWAQYVKAKGIAQLHILEGDFSRRPHSRHNQYT